jgi:ABC-type transport system involved in cytochrome c biogenesis permease subunit
MKKNLPGIVLALALAWVASTLIPRGNSGPFDLAGFGRLPVLADGRIKPLDTIARTALLVLQGRQRVVAPDGQELAPEAWLLDVFFEPETADTDAIIRIDDPDVLSIFNLTRADGEGGVRFSDRQLQAGLAELDRQGRLADPTESAARSSFQRAVIELREHLEYYDRLKYSLQPPGGGDFAAVLADPSQFLAQRAAFESMDTFSPLRVLPPADAAAGPAGWASVGHSLRSVGALTEVDPHIGLYTAIGLAWRRGQPAPFAEAERTYQEELAVRFPGAVRKARAEAFFNGAQPFITSLCLYVVVFLLAAASWLVWPEELGRAAFGVMSVAFALATAGILARMWLEGRPPVTNLYSSALFIGWGSVGLCLILEHLHRNAVASAAGGLIGFSTLVIAHHLSLSGDTLEMMRAVLDSNFWLSTHVVTVTTGYASTFLAGFLAIIYIVRGVFTRSLDGRTADALARMVYGIVCFATLFSFVGTMLGGIWADQSWGRFWGWDPKENGALLIVIWNAIILHCRWGGLVRQRGLMALAVFGNVVTAWSWFGTNMLGIGLHSYGFTDAAFRGLIAFVSSQLVLIALTAIPLEKWRSFRRQATVGTPSRAD